MNLIDLKMPEGLETLQLPSIDLLNTYNLRENRILYLDEDVDYNCMELARQIQTWNLEDKGKAVEDRVPIKLFIFTDGGDMNFAYQLISVIEMSTTPVWTVNAGLACSAGLLILLSGQKRFCYKRSLALIHSGSSMIGGTFEQTEANMKMYKNMVEIMQQYILERTTIDANTFKRRKSIEWYLFDQDQVNNGIVDKIITSMDEIL